MKVLIGICALIALVLIILIISLGIHYKSGFELIIFRLIWVIIPLALIICLYLWANKLTKEDNGWVRDPMNGFYKFVMLGNSIAYIIDGDKLNNSVWRDVVGGQWYGLGPKYGPYSILKFPWDNYTIVYAQGGQSSEPPPGDKPATKKSQDKAKLISSFTDELPKEFDSFVMNTEIDTRDAAFLFYLFNYRFRIVDVNRYIRVPVRGTGGLKKALGLNEAAVEAYNRVYTYKEVEERHKNSNGQDIIDFIIEHTKDDLLELCGLELVDAKISGWGLDDGSPVSKAIKDSLIKEFEGLAKVKEADYAIKVAELELTKAGIDLDIVLKQNLGEEDLQKKLGDENYRVYVKYTRAVAYMTSLTTFVDGTTAIPTVTIK